ncbi:hypothetical protein [Streptomyces sp. NPDC088246]|uniref:hypothetical protein n=1 Tax=Streptomyces sp. NPDC088246 TaxID=3365842 RepID=UPI00382DA88E
MIGRLLDGPLAGRVLKTTDAPWAGGWLTAGDADWGLYVPVHRHPVTDVVPVRVTISRRRESPAPTATRSPRTIPLHMINSKIHPRHSPT